MDKEKEIKAYLAGELLPEVRMKYEIAEEMGNFSEQSSFEFDSYIKRPLDLFRQPPADMPECQCKHDSLHDRRDCKRPPYTI